MLAELGGGKMYSTVTQSLDREQQVQTDPYSPEYILIPDEQPDELAISNLRWGSGLPATSREIRIIREMQVQRRLEQLLPPPTDEFCLSLRTLLMQLQDRRLHIVETALKLRATRIRAKSDAAERRRAEETVETTKCTHAFYYTVIVPSSQTSKLQVPSAPCAPRARRLSASRSIQRICDAPAGEFEELNMIEQQLTQGSPVQLRQSTGGTGTVVRSMLPQALDHTAAALQKEVAAELLTGASIQLQIDLAAAPSSQSASEGGSVAARRLIKRNLRARPETPRVDEVTAEEEQELMAVLLLQQMLRGAARRKLMAEGKEKSLDLVNMLRAAEQLQDIPPEQQQDAVDQHTALETEELVLASAQGAAIAEATHPHGNSILEVTSMANGCYRAQALLEVRLHAEHVADVVDKLQEQDEPPRTVIGGLVKGFLMPRLATQCKERNEQVEAHKYRVASRLAIEDSVGSALSALASLREPGANASSKLLGDPHR
ncbi:hypothetical protein Emed_000748 [Eimeria media]